MRLETEVGGIARSLADDLGLGEADLVEVELAARLRNVGTLRTPARILRGTGAVTPAERELLRLQPRWSAGMVARIPGLEAVALIVRLVHERWDGSGYPDGLAGERIPLASRIVALAAACAAAPLELDAPARSGFDPDLIACLGGAAAGAGVGGPA